MEHNPYQAPAATVADVGVERELAGRGERLVAAIVDTIILLLILLPIMFATGYWQAAMSGEQPGFTTQLLYGLLGFALFVAVQGVPLARTGQTWGKRLMKIRIADLQDAKPSLGTLLGKRYLPVQVIGAIPIAGPLLMIVNVLLIFRGDRRCGHDLIAGTKVVKA
jgi:uncharacterized RDD family membrane protein YckC